MPAGVISIVHQLPPSEGTTTLCLHSPKRLQGTTPLPTFCASISLQIPAPCVSAISASRFPQLGFILSISELPKGTLIIILCLSLCGVKSRSVISIKTYDFCVMISRQ